MIRSEDTTMIIIDVPIITTRQIATLVLPLDVMIKESTQALGIEEG